MGDVARIGRCKVCDRPSRVEDGACAACRKELGPRSGIVIGEARRNPDLARDMIRKAVEMYGNDAGDRFAEMFGLKGSR